MRISDWSSDVCSSDLPGRSDYAVPLLVEISQPVDEARLRQAFNAVIQRHDVLRASFPLIDEIPVQTVHDDRLIPLPRTDLPVTSQVQWRHDLSAALSSLASQPFDLDQGPVVTAALFVPDQPVVAEIGRAHV